MLWAVLGGEIKVDNERVVAVRADQRNNSIVDRLRNGRDDGTEDGLEGLDDCFLNGVHGEIE